MAAWSATIDHLWTELGSPTRYGRESGRSLIGYLSRCSRGTDASAIPGLPTEIGDVAAAIPAAHEPEQPEQASEQDHQDHRDNSGDPHRDKTGQCAQRGAPRVGRSASRPGASALTASGRGQPAACRARGCRSSPYREN